MMIRLVSLSALVLSTTALAERAPTLLASCVVDGESHTIEQLGPDSLRIDGVEDVAFTASRSAEAGYYVETARGNFLHIRASGTEIMVMNSAAWGRCEEGHVNSRALDALVREVNRGRQVYQLARCQDERGQVVNFTFSPSKQPGRALIRATYESDNMRMAFVATGYSEEGAMGSSYFQFAGFGGINYNAAGAHSDEIERLWIRHSNHANTDSIEYNAFGEGQSLTDCKLNNMTALRRVLPLSGRPVR